MLFDRCHNEYRDLFNNIANTSISGVKPSWTPSVSCKSTVGTFQNVCKNVFSTYLTEICFEELLSTISSQFSYLGVPYSHDMCPCVYCFPGHEHCLPEHVAPCHPDNVACPLFVDEKVAEQVRRGVYHALMSI